MNSQTFQKNAWDNLFMKTIYPLFAENDFEYNGVNVSFEPENAEAFKVVPMHNNGSIVHTLNTKIHFSCKDDSTTITAPLITLPVLTANGLTIKNTKWCLINTTSPASGWYLSRDKQGRPLLSLNRGAAAVFSVRLNKNIPSVQISVNSHDTKRTENIPLMEFLKAFSKDPTLQYRDIAETLEDCGIVTNAYHAELRHMEKKNLKEPTTSEAAAKILNLFLGRHEDTVWQDPITELQTRLKNNFLRIGDERIPRLKKFSSFNCALQAGVTAAFPIRTSTVDIEQGGALTDEAIRLLDADDSVKQIAVTYNNNIFTLCKYTPEEYITYEEICFMLHVYDHFINGIGKADDPDEYNNKIIKSIKEYYEDYISRALYKYVVEIKKLLNSDKTRESVDFINQYDFSGVETPLDVIATEISKNSFYQQLDDTNSLALFDQEYKLTTTAKTVSASARDIHPLQYGRVCPYTTPESKQVGLNLSLSVMSNIDEYGFITTPVLPFSRGVLGKEPVYLSAIDEMGTVIAPASVDLEAEWKEHSDVREYVIPNCRINGEVKSAFLSSITHQEVSKAQTVGPLVAAVPSAERNAGKRLIMSAAAQRQALPTWKHERPYVTTGIDALVDIGIVTARTLMEEYLASSRIKPVFTGDEKLYYVKSRKLSDVLEVTFAFSYEGKSYTVKRILSACTSTIKGALKYTRCACPEHKEDLRAYYALDDIVFYNNDIDLREAKFNKETIDFNSCKYNSNKIANHGVAIGSNVKVLFKSYAGYTYEDSIVVNEDFLLRQGLTVVKTTSLKYVLHNNQTVEFDETVLGHQPQLNEQGYPVQGYYVQAGQAVLAVATKTDKEVKYSVETLATGQSGFIMSCTKTPDHGKTIIRIALGEILPVTLGDKLEGLHGNKGVIGRIVPANEMPYTEDGEVADIILNTLGVLARLNLGQMVEFTLGAVAEKTGEIQILEPFSENSVEEIASLAEKYGIVEKEIYDGRTGLKFEKKAMIGNMYMLRLTHTHTSKFNATSNCNSNINARTMQPARGPGGGQRMSELCTWCLMSYDAEDTLSTLFTAQSDDIACKKELDKAIRHQDSTDVPISSSNIEMLQAYFYMFGVNIAVGDTMRLELLTQKFIDSIAPAKCTVISETGQSATPQQILHDARIYPAETAESDKTTLAQLPFHCDMIMPIYLHNLKVIGMIRYLLEDDDGGIPYETNKLTEPALKKLISGDLYISRWESRVVDPTFAQKMEADYDVVLPEEYELPVLAHRSSDITITHDQYGIRGVVSIFKRYNVLSSISARRTEEIEETILFAKNYTLADCVVSSMIIPPPGYRQISKRDKKMSNPIDSRLVEVVGAIKYVATAHSDVDKARAENKLYNTLEKITLKDNEDKKDPSLRKQLSVHSTKSSIMRDTLLAKRMSYTGRSVISIGPDLEFGECGMPISMLATIFDEHISIELYNNNKKYFLKYLAEEIHCDDRSFYRKAIKFISNNNIEGFYNLCIQGQNATAKDLWKAVAEKYNAQHNTHIIVKNTLQLFDTCYQELKDILADLVKKHPTALNREPSLHKFSIQAFDAIPIDSYAIQLHPLNCHGYNADYDGDQMAAIIPMHSKGVKDMRSKMMSVDNMIDPKDGTGIVSLNQDIILGLYYATIHKDNVLAYAEAPEVTTTYCLPHFTGFEIPRGKSYGVAAKIAEDVFLGLIDIHDTVRCFYDGRMYLAEAGRFLLNALLPGATGFTRNLEPDGKSYKLLVDYVLNKKTINTVTSDIIKYFFEFDLGADYTGDTLAAAYNRLMSFGFKMADFSGVTLSIFDFSSLPVKSLIKGEMEETESHTADMDYWYNRGFYTDEAYSESKITAWSSATKSMKSMLEEEFKKGSAFDRNSNIFMIIDSGARGDIYQLLEMSGIIGIVTNSAGDSLETPILASYIDGLTPTSFFLNAYTSRRQTASAQLSTAKAGEFSRKCIYLNDHIVIRPDDKRCDGDSLWIDIEYKCRPIESIKDKVIVLQPEDIESIPDEVLAMSPLFMFDTAPIKEQYHLFCDNIRNLVKAQIYDESFEHLLQLYKQPYFFAKDSQGNYSIINMEYSMSAESKHMLLYRVLDMNSILADNELKGYASIFKERAARIAGDIPESLGEDIVIGDEILSTIETAQIRRVPIFTIIGCHSTEGICRCCFGLKYDTHKFPNFGEHVGYQAVQAIGNPITQMILDSHKAEYTNEESAKDKLDRILNSRSTAEVAKDSVISNLPFTTEDNMMLSIEAKESQYLLTLTSEDNTTTQTMLVPNLLNLKYTQGVIEKQGTPIINVPTASYNYWLHYAPAERVQLDVWHSLCECFKKESILSRNFEVFARSLTEFGTAQKTNTEQGIIKGCTYSINKLRANGIPYTAAFESQSRAMSRGDKILAGVAYEDPVRNICDAVLRGVENNSSSNVGVMLLGTYRTLEHKRYTHSVVAESKTSKAEGTSYFTTPVEEVCPVSTPKPLDPIEQQIFAQIEQLDNKEENIFEAVSEVEVQEAEFEPEASSTSYFTED